MTLIDSGALIHDHGYGSHCCRQTLDKDAPEQSMGARMDRGFEADRSTAAFAALHRDEVERLAQSALHHHCEA
jgi:hypothetical protein